MPIEFRCPMGHRLGAPDHYAGKKIRCPVCREKVRIPQPAAASAPASGESKPPESPPALQPPASVAGAAPVENRQQALPPESTTPSAEPVAPESHEPAAPSPQEPAAQEDLAPDSAPLSEAAPEPRLEEIIVFSDQDDPAWWTLYRPDPGKVQSARMLAFGMAATCVVGAVPGAVYLAQGELPSWAILTLGVAALQLLYLVWVAALPDWSTVWVGMLVFAASGAFYGAVSAWVLFTPPDRPLGFDLEEMRRQALGWSVANLTLCTLVTYAAGRLAGAWRLADQVRYQNELEKRRQQAA